jgi:hypothetical protein
MSLTDPHSGEVAAMHFDERAIAADLAHWCDGVVVTMNHSLCIRLPGARGQNLARLGDWIVRFGEGDFTVMSADDFAIHMEPRPADDPLG